MSTEAVCVQTSPFAVLGTVSTDLKVAEGMNTWEHPRIRLPMCLVVCIWTNSGQDTSKENSTETANQKKGSEENNNGLILQPWQTTPHGACPLTAVQLHSHELQTYILSSILAWNQEETGDVQWTLPQGAKHLASVEQRW